MIYFGILILFLTNIIKIFFYKIVNVKLLLIFILNLNTWFMYELKIILILNSKISVSVAEIQHRRRRRVSDSECARWRQQWQHGSAWTTGRPSSSARVEEDGGGGASSRAAERTVRQGGGEVVCAADNGFPAGPLHNTGRVPFGSPRVTQRDRNLGDRRLDGAGNASGRKPESQSSPTGIRTSPGTVRVGESTVQRGDVDGDDRWSRRWPEVAGAGVAFVGGS